MAFGTVLGFNNNGFFMDIQKPIKHDRCEKGNSLLKSITDFTVIDIETTGFSPDYDSIIELGAIRYRNNEPVAEFQSLVNPKYEIDQFVTELTGISNDMLKWAPSISTVLPEFIEFVGGDILVGHNAHFDINFIYDNCKAVGLPAFRNDFIDTLRLAKRMYKDLEKYNLSSLADYLGVPATSLHRSLADCTVAAECYKKMGAASELFEVATAKTKYSAKDIHAQEGSPDPDNPLYGRVCVFTGTLQSFTRQEAMQKVVNVGGMCEDRVTQRTNLLIMGNNDYCSSIKDGKSNKHKRAEQLIAQGSDLHIITESVFLELLETDDCIAVDETKKDKPTVSAADAELEVFEILITPLREQLISEGIGPDNFIFVHKGIKGSLYSSVCFYNESNVFCRISFRGKQNYISIPARYAPKASEYAQVSTSKSDENYVKIYLENTKDVCNLAPLFRFILNDVLDSLPTEFGCCSRYETCSNARKCVNPNNDLALKCAYRKNLRNGKIFYGRNKTSE